jgi:integrase
MQSRVRGSSPNVPEDAISAFTGARLGEICGMRWRDLDRAAKPLGAGR